MVTTVYRIVTFASDDILFTITSSVGGGRFEVDRGKLLLLGSALLPTSATVGAGPFTGRSLLVRPDAAECRASA
jgi:hypothetical protein